MAEQNVTGADIAQLVGRTAEAASAYIRGDIRKYLTLIKHGDDYTLMPPYGGEPKAWLRRRRGLGSDAEDVPGWRSGS